MNRLRTPPIVSHFLWAALRVAILIVNKYHGSLKTILKLQKAMHYFENGLFQKKNKTNGGVGGGGGDEDIPFERCLKFLGFLLY